MPLTETCPRCHAALRPGQSCQCLPRSAAAVSGPGLPASSAGSPGPILIATSLAAQLMRATKRKRQEQEDEERRKKKGNKPLAGDAAALELALKRGIRKPVDGKGRDVDGGSGAFKVFDVAYDKKKARL